MAYTETTTNSLGNRLSGSIRGMGVGLLLILVGTGLLWWNEGDFVATGGALTEAQGVTQELGNTATLNTALNGQLVHAIGLADTEEALTDPVFQVSTKAIRLERTVEYFQWQENSKSEKKKKLGGGEETVTIYTYATGWTSRPVNSTAFHDPEAARGKVNTTLMSLEDSKIQAKNVRFGAYRLPDFLVNSISGAVSMAVSVPTETLEKLNKSLEPAAELDGAWVQTDWNQQSQQKAVSMVHVSGGTIYIGKAPASPNVGDVRVTFREVPFATVSILAKLHGDSFEAYRANNGKSVSSLRMGSASVENMYGAAHDSNEMITWVLRIAGTLAVIGGLRMIFAPLAVVASIIPLLGTLVGAGVGLASALVGAAWSLLIVAIAWLRFRPLIGGIMLAVAAGLVVLLYIKGKVAKKPNAA